MILLDEILSKFEVGKNSTMTHGDCKILMREAIKQALELAANEATCNNDGPSTTVNKESITSLINKVV